MMKRLTLTVLSLGFLFIFGACGAPLEDEVEVVGSPAQVIANGLESSKRHCVTQTVAVEKGKPRPASVAAPARFDCFATFAEAISFATKGATLLPSTAKPADLREEDLPKVGTLSASYVIGIEYLNADFAGSSLTYTNSEGCDAYNNRYHELGNLFFPWNDSISSAKAFSGCNHAVHYEDAGFSGASYDCGTQCSYIGAALNDRTSSIRWYY